MGAIVPATDFDFKNPNYAEIFAQRAERLQWLRDDPTGERLTNIRAFYATDEGLAHFINDWGMTFDPRNADIGLPTIVPFVLFPKQWEFIAWALSQWRGREPGIAEKSRDWGLTWLAVSLSCSLCLFREGLHIGFGSRKEVYVDAAKEPKAMFHKARQFIEFLPPEFRGSWNRKVNSSHMLLEFPDTGSVMSGEAGDNIGAGDRATLYWVDESALLARPNLIDASLSQTTNCRIDISTPRGRANPFAIKRHNVTWIARGRIFTAHWRDDPRKDDAWYERQQRDLDSITLAQEVDLSYDASAVGIVIPQAWVQSCINLHKKLGFEVRGVRVGAYDPADEGDACAFCDATGILVNSVTSWSGKGSDTLASTQKVFALCDVLGIAEFDYDSDGLGAGVRGDARSLNENRKNKLEARAYRGSGAVAHPDKPIPDAAPRNEKKLPGEVVRLNGDYFENAKAQAWFEARARFQRGHRALEMHLRGEDWRAAYPPDDLISLNGDMPEISALCPQLSQATFTQAKSGKMMIDKTPDGGQSPNHADSVVIRYAPARKRGRVYNWDAWKS